MGRLEFQVADAQTEYERFMHEGAPVTYALRDEPFGQRRFGLHDPAGVWIRATGSRITRRSGAILGHASA